MSAVKRWLCLTDGCGVVLGLILDGVLHPSRPTLVRRVDGVQWVSCPVCRGKRAWTGSQRAA